MSEVLNTSLFLPFGKREVDRRAAEAAVIQDLLCYDRVWVLADQMEATGRLAGMMGWGAFRDAVLEGALRFVHDRSILAWPVRAWSRRIVPFISTASLPQEGSGEGFSQIATGVLAEHSLRAFSTNGKELAKVSSKIDETSLEFGGVDSGTNRPEGSFEHTLAAQLEVFEEAVKKLEGFPLDPLDLRILRREVTSGVSSPLKTNKFNMMKVQATEGADLLKTEQPLEKPQLAMLNLSLSDRFLTLHRRLTPAATLHTEPVVESILRARVASIREAPGEEVSDLLRAKRVFLPVLENHGDFPYDLLMRSRGSRAARRFRELVGQRDESPDATLLQEYLASLDREIGDRIVVKAFRVLVTVVAGALNPALGVVGSVADGFGTDALLARGEASYFIDKTLRRMSAGPQDT